MNISTRQATADDAEPIGRLALEFQAYLRSVGSGSDFDWDASKYLRDGFGENAAFEGLAAEINSQVVGFALYHWGYDTDRGQRLLYLIDLYVAESSRRRGVAEALMRELSVVGRQRGAELIVWSVLKKNTSAIQFYEKLGANYVNDLHVMWCAIS